MIVLLNLIHQKRVYFFGSVKNSNYLLIKTMLDAGVKGPLLPQLDKTSENEIIIRTKIYLCNIDVYILIL